MSCPKCDGFVYFGSKILAVRCESLSGENGVWLYHEAECEDCDWKGIGMQWYQIYEDGTEYKDDVELPTEEDDDTLIRKE